MRLSFVIITYRRPAMLNRCLDCLDLRGHAGVEAVVAFNGPEAGAPDFRAELARRHEHVKVVTIPRASRGTARNLALAHARGAIVYFLDDDVIVPPGFIRRVLDKFSRYAQAPCIGGPNLAVPGATPFQTAVDFLLGSPWGAGPMRARYRATGEDRFLPDWGFMLCNLGVRREVFFGHGLSFPDRCVSAEENLFLYRMARVHGPALYSRELYVHHMRRGDAAAFCRQVFQSGRGRMQITRMEPRSLHMVMLAPAALLAYLVILPFLPRTPLTWAPLAGYALVCFAQALRLWAGARRAAAAVWLPPLIFLGHASYAVGMFSALCCRWRPAKPPC